MFEDKTPLWAVLCADSLAVLLLSVKNRTEKWQQPTSRIALRMWEQIRLFDEPCAARAVVCMPTPVSLCAFLACESVSRRKWQSCADWQIEKKTKNAQIISQNVLDDNRQRQQTESACLMHKDWPGTPGRYPGVKATWNATIKPLKAEVKWSLRSCKPEDVKGKLLLTSSDQWEHVLQKGRQEKRT